MDRTGEIAVGVCADPKDSISSNGFLASSSGPRLTFQSWSTRPATDVEASGYEAVVQWEDDYKSKSKCVDEANIRVI
jgi:hypothetical protein